MAITLPSTPIASESENEVEMSFRIKKIDECYHLLRQLHVGTYTLSIEDTHYSHRRLDKSIHTRKLVIEVNYIVEYGKFIHLRKPYVTKQIKINGKNISYLKTCYTEQLVKLADKLKQFPDLEVNNRNI